MQPTETVSEEVRTRRASLGLDLHDEVWHGEYRMAPSAHWGHGYLQDQVARLLGPEADRQGLIGTSAFNLGVPNNYRVPDHGYHRTRPVGVWNPTAAVVVEVLSPGDGSFDKLPFYAAHGVEEVWIIDPATRTVRCIELSSLADLTHSTVFDIDVDAIATKLDWP
jgi:Uma2 family endonuclease